MQTQIDFYEIPNELRRLLNLSAKTKLIPLVKTVRIHHINDEFFVSFRKTNKFKFARFNELKVLFLEPQAQPYPNLFVMAHDSIRALGGGISETNISENFLRRLLLALRSVGCD
jgi:hypothetical protein